MSTETGADGVSTVTNHWAMSDAPVPPDVRRPRRSTGSRNGSSSRRWSGSANPPSVARNVALGSLPLTICLPRRPPWPRARGSRRGRWRRAARRRRSCPAPARRRSPGPAAPRLTSRCSSVQRRSVSTARPSNVAVPSSRPRSRARSPVGGAPRRRTPAGRRAGGRCRARRRSAGRAACPPSAPARCSRQAGSANRRIACAACRSSVCVTLMSVTGRRRAATSAHVVAGRQLRVAAHVPGGGPAQRARAASRELADGLRSACPASGRRAGSWRRSGRRR